MVPNNININVSVENKHLGWMGGALLASLSTYDNMVMTRQQYDEHGFRFLKKKFLTLD